MHENEGRGIRPGAPKSQEQGRGQGESKEGQALPNVLDYLEYRTTLYEMHAVHRRIGKEECRRKRREMNWLGNELYFKGTDRDQLILELYTEIGYEPAELQRELSREEFKQFRSQVEPMSVEEICEEIYKQEEENRRKRDEARRSRKLSHPPSVIGDPSILLFKDYKDEYDL
jgi:hypothetical protein